MRVRARITAPAPGSTISRGTHTVRGKAWSGTGPVTGVDVSLTGEGDWHPARGRAALGAVPLAGLVVRLGGRRHRPPHPSRPGDGRSRPHPTRGPALEPARIREQRRRGHLHRRWLSSRTHAAVRRASRDRRNGPNRSGRSDKGARRRTTHRRAIASRQRCGGSWRGASPRPALVRPRPRRPRPRDGPLHPSGRSPGTPGRTQERGKQGHPAPSARRRRSAWDRGAGRFAH